MAVIENIECDINEETTFRIADECCTRVQLVYDSENRDFNREHYIVYFTYFVFVENAAIALTPKIIDTMENILANRVGMGDNLDTFAAKRIAVDYMRRFTDLAGEELSAESIQKIVLNIENEFNMPEGSKSAVTLVELTIEIFNTINDRFKSANSCSLN